MLNRPEYSRHKTSVTFGYVWAPKLQGFVFGFKWYANFSCSPWMLGIPTSILSCSHESFWEAVTSSRPHWEQMRKAMMNNLCCSVCGTCYWTPSLVRSRVLASPLHLSIPTNSLSTSNFIAQCPLKPPPSPYRYDKHTSASHQPLAERQFPVLSSTSTCFCCYSCRRSGPHFSLCFSR